MSNSTWLATEQATPFDLGLTMADIMGDLDAGWLPTSRWYADGAAVPAEPSRHS